ncbi:tripartite tricarboxylate transporter substrate binding protein [Virgibacillus dakarensis]|uniref:Bug family tripartite tricarboxylate transporter substrate binding protein n=1 Tax=Virgibacillus dakarensis TaxID=1917889 RepID=UPI000B4498FD|nr:tripartite tricarboxylate transporter substrate binding protein [Virgibacillus dakarensis]MBT2217974.1 tripartite tricarboxylate transporter substrate binding protein [Virgibacillus dakarensis]
MLKKKSLLISMIALLLIIMSACSNSAGGSDEASGENYPDSDIEVYVGHGPGGGTDTFVRTITNLMAEDLDANFNIINQEGGSGVIAMENAMKEEADGYTLVGDSAYAVTTAAGTNQFGLDKVKPIARIQSDVYALQVKKGTFESIDELVAYAEENPGEVRIAAVGTMGIDEITARRFIKEAGVEMNYIPAEGAGNMHSDLLGGHVDVILEEVGPTISYIEEGEFVPLVFFAEERLEDFPDVPTTVEKGWDLTDGVERYLMIHADAPQKIVDLLEESAKKAMETEEYQEYAKNSYLDLRDGWMGSEDFTKKLEKDIEKYKEIIAEIE